MDVSLDPLTHKFTIVKNNFVFLTGKAAVQQAWRLRMRTFKKPAWILSAAIPLGWLDFDDPNGPFAAQTNNAALVAAIRKVTLSTPGITSVVSVTVTTNRAAQSPTRALAVLANGDYGPLDLEISV